MFRLAGALLAGLVTGLPALAQVRAGGEFRVNSATTGTQRTPAVAMGADGGFLVVWTVPDDGSSLGLGGQAFAADGRPLGAEFQVNAFTSGIQLRPAVAASPRGGFVVAWQSEGQDGSGFAAVAALFDGQGRRRGAEFVLNSITTGQQFGPRIGVDAAGRFVAVWSEDGRDGSLSGIVGRRFDAAGSPLGAEFVVNTWTLHLQIGPVVAVAPDGRFVVSWDSYEQDGDDWGVFAQRYSPSAARLGFEFRVNSTVTGPQFGYGVAGDAAGGFVVTWVSPDGQDGDRAGVFAQRYTPSGVRSGSEFQVNVFSQGNQRRASAGSDAAGNFVVAWQADYQDGYWIGITGARFDREGLRREPEFVVNTYTTSFQTYAAAASDASGNVVVVWESVTPAAEIDVFAQRFGGLHAQALALDTAAGPASDGNRVLEPGESVDVL
ncbi:MAG TPA: hypothetical protein VFO85_16130, partial [Vicinamibacteria bacterium]|nr:hypothetical protein [Vicinamibacteria bacterium]